MEDITITEVAEKAEVSPATVSRVVNGSAPVSSSKEERVRKAIQELNYKTNKFASALRKNRSDVVGIVVPDVSNPFFSTLIRGAENQLFNSEKAGMICDLDSKPKREGEYVDKLLREQVDGVIIVSTQKSVSHIKRIQKKGIAIVAADRDPYLEGISKVMANNHKGGNIACDHLIKQGYQTFGFLKGPSGTSTATLRYEGFKEELHDHGLELRNEFVFKGNYSFDGGRKAAKKLIGSIEEQHFPFGIVAADDLMALGAIQEFIKADLDIPNDVGIVGFDNIFMTKLLNPSVSTIQVPAYEMGQEAANILVDNIEIKYKGKSTLITEKIFDVELIPRETSKLEV